MAYESPSRITDEEIVDLIRNICCGHDCVIVVPPFASVTRPALGPHILTEIALSQGMSVGVVYANLIFASMVGVEDYELTCENTNRGWLIGERIFSRVAHGLPRLGMGAGYTLLSRQSDVNLKASGSTKTLEGPRLSLSSIERTEQETSRFCKLTALGLISSRCTIFGVTSSFEQNNAAIAILRAIKEQAPSAVTIVGGANCEGSMAQAVLDLAAGVADFVFSGESEAVFPWALKRISQERLAHGKVIKGAPCRSLDDIPPPNFSTYFEQLAKVLPAVDPKQCWLMYETSRGCWWGQKHHCTFCGLNGEGMAFRQKSATKERAEIQSLFSKSPTRQLAMTDNIMPYTYHNTLIPELKDSKLEAIIFYEQKANLSLEQLKNLHSAGVAVIQPGIESLSTQVLKLMKKGVTAAQNIALLRYARVNDVVLTWNLLTEFPGDSAISIREMLAVIPLLRHLMPPTGVSPLSIDRFSPYFDQSDQYGIVNLRPWPSYAEVFPDHANLQQLAYHFAADYESGSRKEPDTVRQLRNEVEAWRLAWVHDAAPPVLGVSQLDNDRFVLIDSRATEEPRIHFLTRDQARATLVEGPLSALESRWAL